ncbi:MAG TPA: UbiX family flavin prenyltransferase [Alphaproteobacteria bacterium]|nr:UbiX family flavin prenyltransferase [Alphaproteobacteria bacterium]
MNKPRIIVGLTGASGVIYGVRLLDLLAEAGAETHLIITPAGERTLAYETNLKINQVIARAHTHYPYADIGAALASGSFKTEGMVVGCCSIRTMSEIATGVTANLLTRAADVCLKERRKLVLMVRETPLHLGHLRSMAALTEMGAIIAPPLPAFYAQPQSIEEMIDQSVLRIVDLLGFEAPALKRWGEDLKPARPGRAAGPRTKEESA